MSAAAKIGDKIVITELWPTKEGMPDREEVPIMVTFSSRHGV